MARGVAAPLLCLFNAIHEHSNARRYPEVVCLSVLQHEMVVQHHLEQVMIFVSDKANDNDNIRNLARVKLKNSSLEVNHITPSRILHKDTYISFIRAIAQFAEQKKQQCRG